MKKDVRNTVIAVAAVAAVFITAYACLMVYSGTSTIFYTVESGSMRHSDDSRIGVIDAGDMVIVRDPSKTDIITYLDAHGTGYKKFGDYGDVILYKTPGKTIIHRAIAYMELNEYGTWSIQSLKDYKGEWFCKRDLVEFSDVSHLEGTLTFVDFGYNGREFSVNLDYLATVTVPGTGGYITMGDHNTLADQTAGISGIVTADMVTAVAAHEIPWLGCVKLYITGNNTDQIPLNSLLMLVGTITGLILALVAINAVYERTKRDKGN